MRQKAYAVALCGLLAAMGVAVMMAAGLIPILTYCSPMAASLFLLPVLREFGRGRAWMTWAATAALAAILCADREAAFFYIFLGYYPIVKPAYDRLGRVGWAVKLLHFAACIAAMYGLILYVLRLDIELTGTGFMLLLCVALVAVMLIFDVTLGRMTLLYDRRIRPVLFRRMR